MRYNCSIEITNTPKVQQTPRRVLTTRKGYFQMAMNDSTSLKLCSKCGNEYPATNQYFNKDNRDPSGFRNPCKTCKGVKNQVRLCEPLDIGIPGAVGIQLTKGCVAIVDDCDADLARLYWHTTSIKGKPAYACGNVPGGGRATRKIYGYSENVVEMTHRTPVLQNTLQG